MSDTIKEGRRGIAAQAYKAAKQYILKNGIPQSFITPHGNVQAKAVYRAISNFGKLDDEERRIYDGIRNNGEGSLLYTDRNGETSRIGINDDYSQKEIDGAKKFFAASIKRKRTRSRNTITGR